MATINKEGWEESVKLHFNYSSKDFPVVCESCLGENPYVRMSKQPFGKECKVCCRPFTVFRWCPGKNLRLKTTQICVTCCKLKNLCSACALDLDLKMPVRVRDLALGLKDPIAKQNINREYYIQNAEASMAANEGKTDLGTYGKLGAPGREALKRIAESEPYKRRVHMNERNEDKVDMKAGFADPVEAKDKSITTLFITGIPDDTTDEDLRTYFGVWGEIKSSVSVTKKKCAFVTFEQRQSAETAQFSCRGGFTFKGTLCHSHFAKPKQQGPQIEPLMKITKKQPKQLSPDQPITADAIPLPPGAMKVVYPSQLTSQEGSSRNAGKIDK